jgi:hypothetical protein
MDRRLKVRVENEGEVVTLSDGLIVYSDFEAVATGAALPCDVRINVSIDGGTFVVDELRATRKRRGGPIKTELLRKLPVGQILRQAVELVVTSGQSPSEREEAFRPTNLNPEEMLRHVAATYRFGVLIGQTPTQLVAQNLGMSRAAAGRWISRARDEGYLGAAMGTKAGEADG